MATSRTGTEPDIFYGPNLFEPLPGKPGRVHPAAKREAHEYRTDQGFLLVRAFTQRESLRRHRPDRTRLGSLERHRRRSAGALTPGNLPGQARNWHAATQHCH